MPRTSAQLASDYPGLPTRSANPTIVTVTLIFRGVNFQAEGLRAALDAAYPTVTSPRDETHRSGGGPFEFEISP